MKYWYGRVSTAAQNLDSQEKMAEDLGIPKSRRFWDKKSGRNRGREGLENCLEVLEEGDELHVARLDRLARSTKDLMDILEELKVKGCTLHSVAEPLLNNDSAMGKLVIGVLSILVEFEVNLSKERQLAGIAEAKLKGKYLGRKSKFTPAQKKTIYSAYYRGEGTVAQLAKWHGVSEGTIRNVIKEREKEGI